MKTTVEQRVERIKAEVVADIAWGIIPATVSSFSALHDYVDANTYGGMCDDDDDWDMSEDIDLYNAATDAVDRWLKNGRQEAPSA